jgi:hypothetical protein
MQKGFKGLSISFNAVKETESNKKIQYRLTAWYGQNEFVGTKSKLGAFISAFSDYYEIKGDTPDIAIEKAQDTSTWLNHTVKFLEWRNKNREIKVTS